MTTERLLRVRNWEVFQHYKDRSPPWIRLHKSYLDDFDFQRLPVASRALAPMLWLLASENADLKSGIFDGNLEKIAFRLRMSADELDQALKPLIEKKFIEVVQDASNALADCSPETETETETEAETETETETAADEVRIAFDEYNAVAGQCDLPEAKALTDTRRKHLRARLESVGLDGWRAALARVRASSFCQGNNDRGWVVDIDFLLKENSFVKLCEGKYDDRKAKPPPVSEGVRRAQEENAALMDQFVGGARVSG